MAVMEVHAYAKLNLSLDVLEKRPDGYHEMKMVMVSTTLCDDVVLTRGGEGLRVRTNLNFLPNNEKNLAAQAVLAFSRVTGRAIDALEIAIEKRVPVCAGMAGGSADAAAALRGMNALTGAGLSAEELARIGAQVGSDVPYCVMGGTMLAQGRGETLTPLPSLPRCWLAICKPGFSISTPELFRRLDGSRIRRRPDTAGLLECLEREDLTGVARRLYNVFEDVLPQRCGREVQAIKQVMIQQGALGAGMSGTGPTVFGIFDQRDLAEAAVEELSQDGRECFLAEGR